MELAHCQAVYNGYLSLVVYRENLHKVVSNQSWGSYFKKVTSYLLLNTFVPQFHSTSYFKVIRSYTISHFHVLVY